MNIEVVKHVNDVDLEAEPDDLRNELNDPANTRTLMDFPF